MIIGRGVSLIKILFNLIEPYGEVEAIVVCFWYLWIVMHAYELVGYFKKGNSIIM
jgi:uncharacterized protein YhhL (DUF1145 family)